MSCVFVLKGSSRLGGSTLSHHVTPSLLLLLPDLLKRERGGGPMTYLYSRPLSRKTNKALSFFFYLLRAEVRVEGREAFMTAFPQISQVCRLPNLIEKRLMSGFVFFSSSLVLDDDYNNYLCTLNRPWWSAVPEF